MNDRDPLHALRELPLEPIPPALSAKIRGEAHLRLRKRRAASSLLAAAVVLLCVSHLGWTLTFMQNVQVPAASLAVSVLR